MRLLIAPIAVVGMFLAASVFAGTLRDTVDMHQRAHGEGTVTTAQWEAYRDHVDGTTIGWEAVEVDDVDCEKDYCSVSAFPVPKGNDFLPRVTKKVPKDFGLGLSKGDTIRIKGEVDISDFLVFNITVK